MYLQVRGLGVKQDHQTAFKLFTTAVEQGEHGAQYWLGN